MVQTGFYFSDEGRTLAVENDSTTTAITAGDLVYVVASANDDVLTQTSSTARAAYAAGNVKVKRCADATTVAVNKFLGVAVEDIAADGRGAIAMEGVWMHAVSEGVEAGAPAQVYEATANKLSALDAATTTVGTAIVADKCGRFITGASGANEYVMWKLSL